MTLLLLAQVTQMQYLNKAQKGRKFRFFKVLHLNNPLLVFTKHTRNFFLSYGLSLTGSL